MEQRSNRLGKLLFPGIYNEGKGDVTPMPERGWKLFSFLLSTYFFKLIALNLLTIALCVPVFTIPASLTALSRVLMKLARQGYCSVSQEFFSEWKSALVRYLPFGLISALPVAAAAAFAYIGLSAFSGVGGIVLAAACALITLLCYLVCCYAYPLFAMIDLPVMQNVRNALFFAATQHKTNFALLLPVVTVFAFLLFWPWTVPVFLLFLVSIPALMICCIVKPLIEEYVIQPFYTNAEASASNNQQGDESK